MEKVAIAMINHKGGVGKTSLAYILSQIGLSRGLKVTAVDLDPQKNFSDALALVTKTNETEYPYFKESLKITNEITDEGDLIIIDCPPALNEFTASAIDFADITLIPVMPDLFSVANLALVYKLGQERDKNTEQLAVVKIGFDKRALVDLIATTISGRDYRVAGGVPINRLIPYNITTGRVWEYGMSGEARKPYYALFDMVCGAYGEMLAGNFNNPWEVK